MATKKTMKFKEADPITSDPITGNQIVDQNAPAAAPVPATDAEVAQATEAAPVLADPVMPNDGSEPVEPVEDNGIQVNPETVGVEVQIPTDQLAQAVAQATGDVAPAEIAPDAIAAQEDELVAEQPTEEVTEAPVEAPVDAAVQPEQAPVLESCESKDEKIEESESSELEAKLEGDLNRIITTGVENTAKGLSDGKATIDSENKENRLEVIDAGVEKTGDSLTESEDPIKDAGSIPVEEEKCEDGECEEGEKLDFNKLAAEVSEEEDNSELPPAMEDSEGIDPEVDASIFDDVDVDEDAVNDFMAKMDSFLKDEDKAEEVADSLRTVADVIEKVAEPEGEEVFDDEDDEEEIFDRDVNDFDDEEEKLDFDSLIAGAYDEDDFEDEEDEEEDEEIEESLVRVPCKFPKKDSIKEHREPGRPEVTRRLEPKKIEESLDGIKFPAGSEPMVERQQNLVEAHDRVVRARREAIANFRESVKSEQAVRNPKFNEALRSSVRLTERSKNTSAWSNNQFYEKYEESSKLDFKTLLNEGYLG